MTAGFVAIALGLVILGVGTYEYLGNRPKESVYGSQTITVDGDAPTGAVDPVDDGGGALGKLRTDTSTAAPKPSVFDNEYGPRGPHTVTISVSGTRAGYAAQWRDGHKVTGTTSGTWSVTRTVTGGLPLGEVTIQGIKSASASCTITIDGEEKVSESITKAWGVTWCVA